MSNQKTDINLEWLRRNKQSLSINSINDQIGMPSTTLQKAVSGIRGLSDKWEDPLNEFIENLKRDL